ncbi:MAG: hypothetical protein QXE18_00950, partial [Thermoplasmata archaeon]
AVCNEATMLAIRDIVADQGAELSDEELEKRKVGKKYFEKAMEHIEPRTDLDGQIYRRFSSKTSPNAGYR